MEVSYVDEGGMAKALKELDKQYALAERIGDAAMSGDLVLMGNILYKPGKYDKALARYEEAVGVVKKSDLSQEVKDNTELNFLYNAAVISMKKDFRDARGRRNSILKEPKPSAIPTRYAWLTRLRA